MGIIITDLKVSFKVRNRKYERKLEKPILLSDLGQHLLVMYKKFKEDVKFFHEGEV